MHVAEGLADSTSDSTPFYKVTNKSCAHFQGSLMEASEDVEILSLLIESGLCVCIFSIKALVEEEGPGATRSNDDM